MAVGLAVGCSESTGFEGSVCNVPTDLIFDGGPGRDGIPALTNPEVLSANAADFLSPGRRVLGLVVNGEPRAYPLIVMWWHEMVNDTLGGEPVLVTYCPLTGSGVAFDPVVDGQLRNFGVSGLLFENNLIMFDRETESLWTQLGMFSMCGEEVGTVLDRLPVIETTWGYWKKLYPNTTIVSTNTGFDRAYGEYPYGNYDVPFNPVTLFPSSPYSDARPPKEPILGLMEGEAFKAFPFFALRDGIGGGDGGVVNDSVAGLPVVVTYVIDDLTAIAFDRRVGDQTLTFAVADTAAMTLTDAETGSTWDALGNAIGGPLMGEQLRQLTDAHQVFWFAWSVFRRSTALHR